MTSPLNHITQLMICYCIRHTRKHHADAAHSISCMNLHCSTGVVHKGERTLLIYDTCLSEPTCGQNVVPSSMIKPNKSLIRSRLRGSCPGVTICRRRHTAAGTHWLNNYWLCHHGNISFHTSVLFMVVERKKTKQKTQKCFECNS